MRHVRSDINIATNMREVQDRLEPNQRYHFDWNADQALWDVFENVSPT